MKSGFFRILKSKKTTDKPESAEQPEQPTAADTSTSVQTSNPNEEAETTKKADHQAENTEQPEQPTAEDTSASVQTDKPNKKTETTKKKADNKSKSTKQPEQPAAPVIYPLAPTIPADEDTKRNYETYKKYFDAAFQNKEIRNIAFTGDFGIGKSSFLKWYGKDKNFLTVSLCDFTGNAAEDNAGKTSDTDNDANADNNSKLDALGCDICQQMRIACNAARKKKRKITSRISAIFLILLLIIIFFHHITDNIFLSQFSQSLNKTFTICGNIINLSDILNVFLFIFIAVAIIKYREMLSLSKITLKIPKTDSEIELEHGKSLSYLDMVKVNLIEELAEAAEDYDYTVIFEDFDRLEYRQYTALFTEMREINRLVNLSHTDNPVRFIYVIKDSLFISDKETTNELHLKFFDYIIPFISEIYRGNSDWYIKECLDNINDNFNNKDTRHTIHEEYSKITSPYLFDYKKIRNIANECQVILDYYYKKYKAVDFKASSTIVNVPELNIANIYKTFLALATLKTLLPMEYESIRINGIDCNFEDKICNKSRCIHALYRDGWFNYFDEFREHYCHR